MYHLTLILGSLLMQLAAVGVALRISRRSGGSRTWWLLSSALVLMAANRVFLLAEYLRQGLPDRLLTNEFMALVISVLLLLGMVSLRGLFEDKSLQAAGLEEARVLAQAEADKLTAVMAATPVPLWIAQDPTCRVIHGNPAAAELLRMPLAANHSASAPQGEQPEHFQLVQGGMPLAAENMPMQRAAQRGERVQGEPIDLVFTDGECRHLTAYATPLRGAGGSILGAVCCLVDLTEIRRAEAALAKAHKMESLGLLAGGLAHDLNNFFQTMVANLEMAKSAQAEGRPAGTYLEGLQAALDRASRLSRDILHCSGGDLRRPESVDLSSLVRDTLERLELPLTQALAPLLPRVMMDPLLVGRVIEGLVTNALEAGSQPSAVSVRTRMRQVQTQDLATGHWPEPVEPGLYAVLEVADQGHGIAAETIPKIFDPFFSTRDVGRGLGLPAALGIVRGHRGGIQVESIPGVGSVFRVHFPSPESLEAPPLVARVNAQPQNLVLLADDEPELRSILAEMLVAWFGLEVVCASDGLEALELFAQRPEAFDLLIIDATMPRMNGVEAFRRMRELRPGIPGILCSGYALSDSREEAVTQGFSDFLKKPFTSAELRAILQRVLGSVG